MKSVTFRAHPMAVTAVVMLITSCDSPRVGNPGGLSTRTYLIVRESGQNSSTCPFRTTHGSLSCVRHLNPQISGHVALKSIKTYVEPREDITGEFCGADLCIWADDKVFDFSNGLFNVEHSLANAEAIAVSRSPSGRIFVIIQREAGGEYTAEAYVPPADIGHEQVNQIKALIGGL